MNLETLLTIVGDEPVFETGLLLAGDVEPGDVRRQLSRWTGAGKIVQLRRGLYCLAPPYLKGRPEPFLLANWLRRPSYVSCESALAFYGLIPEGAPVTGSVTTGRPCAVETPVGRFRYRHIQVDLFWGYEAIPLADGRVALVATPEKALLDLVYLTPDGDSPDYLRELRLQRLEGLDAGKLESLARRTASPKLVRAAAFVSSLVDEDAAEYRSL